MEEMRVYVANLGKYNEGELVGAWFEPPIDYDEMAERTNFMRNTRYTTTSCLLKSENIRQSRKSTACVKWWRICRSISKTI